MKILFSLLLILSFSTGLALDLRVLSWNLMLIPKPFSFTNQSQRAHKITQQLQNFSFDIIVFQELFSTNEQTLIAQNLKTHYPFQTSLETEKKFYKLVNSGLLIASKYPFNILTKEYYLECDFFTDDCFSSKGVIFIELLIEQNKKIQLAFTHLQSGEEKRDQEIRLTQLNQIKYLFNKFQKKDVAQVLIGDLNINYYQNSEFKTALNFLQMDSAPLSPGLDYTFGHDVSCFETFSFMNNDNVTKEWIDHCWVKPNNSQIKIKEQRVIPFNGLINNVPCPLSDHHGLDITLTL